MECSTSVAIQAIPPPLFVACKLATVGDCISQKD